MANEERKLSTTALIPLEIDPGSILSLSKGVIFDTIVHNIGCTFSNRCSDSLPWKLVGMSLICDPDRNKKYLQKLQKMQCVPSVISTQIYHSKLIKTESDKLTTPGRKVIIPTIPRKRLTGIIVCRSIDELLYMEPPNTQSVHYIQYKLLSYQRIATRELINGPKLSSVTDKLIKTVFDFELSQNNGFPRQLLPFAIISFARQEGCDLCSSIRNFLNLDEHKTFDKTYLVTTVSTEIESLREEQERREEDEAEQELPWEKIQRRQPLADLSKKTTDGGNARPSAIPQPIARVPPLKLDLSRIQKPAKSTVTLPPLDSKYRCLLKLDKIDLSSYDISNLSKISKAKEQKTNQPSPSSDVENNKIKTVDISRPHEHTKPLKRLNTTETKKASSNSPESSKEQKNDKSVPLRTSIDSSTALSNENKIERRTSATLVKKRPTTENPTIKKIVKRPVLPREYHCFLNLSRIDLSMYNIDLPEIPTVTKGSSTNVKSGSTTLPSLSTSSNTQTESMDISVEQSNATNTVQPMSTPETENSCDPKQTVTCEVQTFEDLGIHGASPIRSHTILSSSTNELLPQGNDEDFLTVIDDNTILSPSESSLDSTNDNTSTMANASTSINENIPPVYEPISPIQLNENQSDRAMSDVTQEAEPTVQDKDNNRPVPTSPITPPSNDNPILFPIETLKTVRNTSAGTAQEYLIIVPCSDDDDDDFDDEEISRNTMNVNNIKTEYDVIESATSPTGSYVSPVLSNQSLARILNDISSLNSHRSPTSSCSSLSSSVLHNQSPQVSLDLTEVSIPQKILNKKQNRTYQALSFSRFNINIPLSVNEPLVDPRLIYRLQAITTDLRWPSPCKQCALSPQLSPSFHCSTQMISYEKNDSSDFVDPRRESLKQAILNLIYQRLKLLKPHLFTNNSSQCGTLLFGHTVFKTNCSIHLEYLLQKLRQTDETNFFHMIKNQEEFELSSSFLQLIFI